MTCHRSSVEECRGPNSDVAGSIPAGGSNPTIEQLDEINRLQIYEHLIRLSKEDRYLRFCSTVNDSFIHRYVYSMMNLARDPVYGAFIDGKLIGIASIAVIDAKSCELAFSIDYGYRGTGLARNLMKTAIARCHELGMQKLCMSCLRTNKKMQALARSFGLSMTIEFDEAYAELGITK